MFDIYLPCNHLKNWHKYQIPNAKHFTSTSHFFEISLSNGLGKISFYESPFHLLAVLSTSSSATTRTGARGRRLSNHNVFLVAIFVGGEIVWWRGDRIPKIFNLPWVWEVSAQVPPDRLRFTKQIKATTTTQIMKPTETMAMMYLYCELVFTITCWGFLVLPEWTCWRVAERNSKGKSGLWTTFSEDIFLLFS